MRLSSFAFFLAPWLALAGTARAEGSAQLSWTRSEGAETCATRAEIARRVAARLGRDPFVVRAGEDSLALEGVVDRAAGGAYRARIYAEPSACASATCPRVVRELTGDAASCASLDGAVVLALALTIDPTALSSPVPSPAHAPLPPPPLPTHPVPIAREAPAVTAPAREGLRGAFAAHATLLGNVLPSPSFGAGLEGRLRAGSRVTLSLGGLVQPEIRDGDYAFGLSAGSAGACLGTSLGPRVQVEGCGRALVGGMHAVVYRLEPTEPGQRVWVAATLGASIALRVVGPFGVEASGFGLASLVRPRFYVSGTDATVFQVPAGGYGASLGFFARL